MTFPEVQRADCYKVVATQGREGMQRQGKSSQEIIVTPWDRVLVPPQGIHITLFLSSLQTLISQQNGRCQHSSFQTSQFDKLKRLIRRLFEGNPVGEGTTRRGTATPVHHPGKPQGSKIPADGDCSHEIKRRLLFGRKVMTNLDSIFKNRHYFANTGPSSQGYGFSSSHVWM